MGGADHRIGNDLVTPRHFELEFPRLKVFDSQAEPLMKRRNSEHVFQSISIDH